MVSKLTQALRGVHYVSAYSMTWLKMEILFDWSKWKAAFRLVENLERLCVTVVPGVSIGMVRDICHSNRLNWKI